MNLIEFKNNCIFCNKQIDFYKYNYCCARVVSLRNPLVLTTYYAGENFQLSKIKDNTNFIFYINFNSSDLLESVVIKNVVWKVSAKEELVNFINKYIENTIFE